MFAPSLPPPLSLPLGQPHSTQRLGHNWREMTALFAVLLCFASPFSQCYFLLPNHWNNLIKTTKKPDVSFVETSSVPISQGEGSINTKCLFFKTFHSFTFNFHFKICQSSSKILLLFNIIMFLSKQELIKSIQSQSY